jgi:DNA-directed RNA polymerase subunit K/omega
MDHIHFRKYLSRFEMARIVSLRAMKLSEGAKPKVFVEDKMLYSDPIYVACLELFHKKIDGLVQRGSEFYQIDSLESPIDLINILDARDGGERS